MASYSFYPRTTAGAALMFEVAEQPTDAAAATQARRILADHASAVEVAVWRDESFAFAISAQTDSKSGT